MSARSSSPASRACITRTAVIVLVIEPMRYWPSRPGAIAGTTGPHRAVAVEDGTDHRRQPALGLRDVEQPLPLIAHSANASGGGQAQTRLRSP